MTREALGRLSSGAGAAAAAAEAAPSAPSAPAAPRRTAGDVPPPPRQAAHRHLLPYVYTNPRADTRLRLGDAVFVLSQCDPKTFGW